MAINNTNVWSSDEALFRLTVANLARTAPLKPAEERSLILEMDLGNKAAARLKKEVSLDEESKKSLQEAAKKGQRARRRLIEANGRLVISIANRYMGHGLSLAELSQEGVLGLIRAIDKFDPAREVRLSTYASYWIRQSVSRAVAVQTRTIRLPVHKVDQLGKLRKVSTLLSQELGREPKVEEISALIEDSTPAQINTLLVEGQETLSLEEPIGDEGAVLGDFVTTDSEQTMEQTVDTSLLHKEILSALESLSARESRIVELRYGLRDGHPLTLQDVAERFGLTRERIRQIEREALAKLRHTSDGARLRTFTY
jgi:RNA polymerase sigma factor (sigma-70 family)